MKQRKSDFKLRRVTTKTVTLLARSTQKEAYRKAEEDAVQLKDERPTYILTGTHYGKIGFMACIGHFDVFKNLRWVEVKWPRKQ